jgi:excisionase family DNA binding protein
VSERLLTVHETAHVLGVSTKTIRRWIGAGRLRSHRLGRKVIRVDGSSVAHLLAASGTTAAEGVHDVKENETAKNAPDSVRYKVYEETGRGFVLRFYGANGRRQAHRVPSEHSATLEAAERYAAGWIAANVNVGAPRRRAPRRHLEGPTFEQFARSWCSGELSRRYPDHVHEKASARDDESRFERYVFPVIGSESVRAFEGSAGLDLVEKVMSALPVGPNGLAPSSRRHIAQCIHRVLTLAVFPARLLPANPLPRGFLPRQRPPRGKSYLYPSEDAQLMECVEVALNERIFYGLMPREGFRVSEGLDLRWRDLDLERGSVTLDHNKTDDARTWALDPGVTEALRRWRAMLGRRAAPSSRVLAGMNGQLIDRYEAARRLREHLKMAGITRPQLFEESDARLPLRAHDLRASFVTVNLALGKSEAWITDRTGHRSSQMIYTYKRSARTHADLGLGGFRPLHEAIPELRALGGSEADPNLIPS